VSVGVGVGLVDVGVGVGVGLGAESCSGSHCWTITLAKRAVTVGPSTVVTYCGPNGAADAAGASTVNDATRTPPVTKPTAPGRTCAKRMINAPTSAVRLLLRNDYSVWSGCIRRRTPPLGRTPSIGHHALCSALLPAVQFSLQPSGLQAHHDLPDAA
jgi:hypothetical protein